MGVELPLFLHSIARRSSCIALHGEAKLLEEGNIALCLLSHVKSRLAVSHVSCDACRNQHQNLQGRVAEAPSSPLSPQKITPKSMPCRSMRWHPHSEWTVHVFRAAAALAAGGVAGGGRAPQWPPTWSGSWATTYWWGAFGLARLVFGFSWSGATACLKVCYCWGELGGLLEQHGQASRAALAGRLSGVPLLAVLHLPLLPRLA